IMRDPDTGNSRGFGFISYDSFEASDAAIEAMTGQYLSNRQVTVSYAYKKDSKGERHGTPTERLLAADSQRSKPHMRFATIPTTQSTNAPRLFANGSMQPVPIPAHRPPPSVPQAYQTQPPFWSSQQQQQQNGLVIPPPAKQFRPPQSVLPPPPPQFHHHQQGYGGPRVPPPPPQLMGMYQHDWPQQHMQQGGTTPEQQLPMNHHHHHMSMPPPPPPHQG
ncbi:hypothetical protein CARUB_v100079351mg, partial [Capsella rubella]